jgi:phosphatidylglycerophosphatase A
MPSPHGYYFSLNGFLWQMAAFFLFRLFDIIKLPPAGYFDTKVKNGFGVMMDDVMAAGHTVIVLAIAKTVLS